MAVDVASIGALCDCQCFECLYEGSHPAHGPGGRRDRRTCRVCGCTDGRACPSGCMWVQDDLCSSCETGVS